MGGVLMDPGFGCRMRKPQIPADDRLEAANLAEYASKYFRIGPGSFGGELFPGQLTPLKNRLFRSIS